MSLVLLMAACPWIYDEELDAKVRERGGPVGVVDTGTDSATDTDTAPIVAPEFLSIDPAFGSTAGGTEFTLRGEFLADVTVEVGGHEAELSSVSPESGTLVGVLPEGVAGPATVSLTGGGARTDAEGAFTYYLDGTGLPGVYGELLWIDMVGSYWSTDPVDYGYAYFAFVEPTDWTEEQLWSASVDTCTSSMDTTAAPAFATYAMSEGSTAALATGATTINLAYSSDWGGFYVDDVTTDDLKFGSEYALSELSLGADSAVPAFTLDAFTYLPAAFLVTTPAITGSTVPSVSATIPVTWTGGAAGDGVFLSLQLFDAGDSIQETVSCWAKDDGNFTVPGATWKSWTVDRQVNVVVYRFHKGEGTLPYNNARAGMLGEYAVYGAAFSK